MTVNIHDAVAPPVVCIRQEIMRQVVDRASPYLYPCTIEYCLIAAGEVYMDCEGGGYGYDFLGVFILYNVMLYL